MPKNTHESDVAFIKALAELLNENDLTELQVKRDYGEDDSLNVRVSRRQEVVAQAMMPAPAQAPAAAAGAGAPAALPPAPAPPPTTPPIIPAPSPRRWSAPSICRPNPARRAFVTVGDKVGRRRHAADRRSDEDHEPHPGPARGHRQTHSGRRWRRCRIRRTA